ncbi:hypothetical protein WA556_003992 [Blastocystis sp. ATCC 50177/Nand II]
MNAPHRPPYIFNKDTLKLRVELDRGVVEVDARATSLDLTNRDLSDENLKLVLGLFDYMPLREHLKKLLLGHNKITYVGACSIAESIHAGFPQLDTFDISYNSIGDKGLEVIASTLRRQNPSPCPVLREFNVSCNGITVAGALHINKLIRRTDGTLNVLFENNPINGDGLGYIISAKFWESFSINNTNADDGFQQFVRSYSGKAFNLKHLTIIHNHLSQANFPYLSSLLTCIPVPTLQTLKIEEPLGAEGMNVLVSVAKHRSVASLKQLTLYHCAQTPSLVFTLVQEITRGGYPMLKELAVAEDAFELTMHFVTTITDHKCLDMLMKTPSTRWTDEIATSFFLPASTASFEWQNTGALPLACIFNASLLALSLLDLRSVQITTCYETVDSLLRFFASLPPSLQTLKIDGLTLSSPDTAPDAATDTKIDPAADPKIDPKIDPKPLHALHPYMIQLSFSHVTEPSLLVRALAEVVSNELALNLEDVPLTDADIGTLFEGMRKKGVVVRELQVKKDGLSPESIQMVSLMSPPVVTPPPEDNGAIRTTGNSV